MVDSVNEKGGSIFNFSFRVICAPEVRGLRERGGENEGVREKGTYRGRGGRVA